MKFMLIRKADEETEAGAKAGEKLIQDMANYNEEMLKRGVMIDGMGLHPSSRGARVKFSKGKPRVIDGPFTEAKELIAGFTLIEAKSKEEAIEWVKRWPASDANGNVEIEIRQVYELDELGSGEGIEHHRRLQEQMKKK